MTATSQNDRERLGIPGEGDGVTMYPPFAESERGKKGAGIEGGRKKTKFGLPLGCGEKGGKREEI